MSGGDIGTGNLDQRGDQGGGAVEPDDGFTAEERAQWEQMQADTPMPQGGAAEGDGDGGGAGAGDATGGAGTAGVGDGAVKTAGTGTEEDDDGDGAEDDAGAAAAGAGTGTKDGGEKPPPRRVPYKRFEKAQTERDAAVREAQEARETLARFQERMAIINEAIGGKQQQQQQQQQQDEDPEPDPNEDFIAHAAWLGRQLKRSNDRFTQMETSQRERDQQQRVERAYVQDYSRFRATEPAFDAAYTFLMRNRYAELAVLSYGKEAKDLTGEEQGQILQTIEDEERELVTRSVTSKKSPAALIFSLARQRGFTPPAKEDAAAATAAAGKQNGAAAAGGAAQNGKAARTPGNLADAAETVSAELKRVQKAVDASTSLSQGGGAPAPVSLRPEDLANMPQEEFDAMMEKLRPDEVKRLMGG